MSESVSVEKRLEMLERRVADLEAALRRSHEREVIRQNAEIDRRRLEASY